MNRSLLDHHWKPGSAEGPFLSSMGLLSAPMIPHAGLELGTLGLARGRLTSRPLSRDLTLFLSKSNQSTILSNHLPLSSVNNYLTPDTAELHWSRLLTSEHMIIISIGLWRLLSFGWDQELDARGWAIAFEADGSGFESSVRDRECARTKRPSAASRFSMVI